MEIRQFAEATSISMNLLHDMLLSFCPEAVRRKHRPYSPAALTSLAAALGLVQFVVCALLLLERYRHFFIARAHQWAAQMNGQAEWVQSGSAAIVTFEFFLYPLSLLLLYFMFEGLLRFAAGIATSEVVPSLPVVLAFKAMETVEKRREIKHILSLPPDRVEMLPNGNVRIASALHKAGWDASITIGLDDRWYEVEREMQENGPLPWVYLLRPSPIGKIFRRVEQYEPQREPASSEPAQPKSNHVH